MFPPRCLPMSNFLSFTIMFSTSKSYSCASSDLPQTRPCMSLVYNYPVRIKAIGFVCQLSPQKSPNQKFQASRWSLIACDLFVRSSKKTVFFLLLNGRHSPQALQSCDYGPPHLSTTTICWFVLSLHLCNAFFSISKPIFKRSYKMIQWSKIWTIISWCLTFHIHFYSKRHHWCLQD